MSVQTPQSESIGRRAELLTELFFQELDPLFVSRPATPDAGYDLLVGFANEKGGVNTIAVEVKSTERPPASPYPVERKTFSRLAHSNIPGLLLVADVKRNRLYHGWLRAGQAKPGATNVLVPITEIDETAREELVRQLKRVEAGVAAAG